MDSSSLSDLKLRIMDTSADIIRFGDLLVDIEREKYHIDLQKFQDRLGFDNDDWTWEDVYQIIIDRKWTFSMVWVAFTACLEEE